MAPPSKKRVQSSVKKESSKKEKSPKTPLPNKNKGEDSVERSSKKKALAFSEPPTRKLFDHRFVKQDCFFSRAQKLKLEVVSSVAHTYAEPDNIEDAFSIPPEDTSKFRLMRVDYTAVPILFRCPARPSPEWRSWVSSELENLSAKDQLRSAGILSALMSSTQLGIFRDIRGMRHLVRRWNKTTHTFVCSWGEFTPTLDDVSKLLRLPVMGDASPFFIELSDEEMEIENNLVEGLSLCRQLENKRQSSRPSFACWIRYFWGTMERNKFQPGAGYGKGCRLEALVCLWLCKFVFPELQGDIVQRRVFSLAIKLARGVRFPLAPIFLGTFYKHLDMILEDEILAAGRYTIDTELAINFLQVFLWERIKKYAGEPASGKSVVHELGINSELPLWSRWFHMKQTKPSIWFFIDDIDNFTFRPYVRLGNEFGLNANGNEASSTSDIVKVPMCDSNGNWADLEYLVSIRPGLLPAWIGSEIHSINYWPHRVLRQFGLDQGVPRPYSLSDGDVLNSPSFGMSRFIYSSLKSLPTIKSLMIQIACNERQGLYTPKFVMYWKKTISDFNQFIRSPRSVCKALPPMSVPKRLRLDTREVRSLSTKIGMPFTIIDGTYREVVGAVRKWQKADDLEENLPLIDAFPKNTTVEENDPSSDQQTPCNMPSKKRALTKLNSLQHSRIDAFPQNSTVEESDPSLDQQTPSNTASKKSDLPKPNSLQCGRIDTLPKNSTVEENDHSLDQQTPCTTPSKKRSLTKPKSMAPKRKSARLLEKSLSSEDIVMKENGSKPPEDSQCDEGADASAESNGNGLNPSQSKEDNGGNKKLKSEVDNSLNSEIAIVSQTLDDQESRDLPLAIVPENTYPPDQSPEQSQTRSSSAKRPREGISANDDLTKGAKRREVENGTADSGTNGEIALRRATATTLETAAGDSCWQSDLKRFLGAFYGNSVAPHSIEEFLKLSGRTKILNDITVPEESFQPMSEAIEKHGDFVASCWASKPVRNIMFSRLSLVFHCLTQIPLSKLSEDVVLALRDVVREATAVGFGVDFLLDHLRKLVSALFGRRIYFDKLTALDSQIEIAQKEFDLARAKLEELKNSRSEIVAKAGVSTGTEGDCIRQALDFCTSLVEGL